MFFLAGRYCEWKHLTIDRSAEIETFEEYMKTLRLDCEDGEPGYLNWTVPMDAPDLLYYQVSQKQKTNYFKTKHLYTLNFQNLFRKQCFTHNNLGWKINIIDPRGSAGSVHQSSVIYTIMPCLLTIIVSLVVRKTISQIQSIA